MRKFVVGAFAAGMLAVCGATSLGQPARFVPAVIRNGQAAWYVGSTSTGTRVEFRLSPSGLWVRDFYFGSPLGPTPAGIAGQWDFPMSGLRVRDGRFDGQLHPEDDTPQTPDQPYAAISGRFIDKGQVTGTVEAVSRSGTYSSATFTATRIRLLPARPTSGGNYAASIHRSLSLPEPLNVHFGVSRSGRRVTAFRIGRIYTNCKYPDTTSQFRLAHSYPAAGLSKNRLGVFTGTLSSRLTPKGRPAGIRVRVSVLFLSAREATGTVRLLGRDCMYETLVWRAELIP